MEEETKNSFRCMALKQLLNELKQQYHKKFFDIDKSIHQCVETVVKKGLVNTATQGSQNIQSKGKQLNSNGQKNILQNLQEQLTTIAVSISKSPSAWIQLLQKDQICAQKSDIIINKAPALTKVYRKVVKKIDKEFVKQDGKVYNHIKFEENYMNKQNMVIFAELLFIISEKLCRNYEASSIFIKKKMEEIQQKIKKSTLMNTYFLFAILKQQTMKIQNQIQGNMIESMFKNSPTAPNQVFTQYVLKNYERLLLFHSNTEQPKIFTPEQQKQFNEAQKKKWMDYLNNAGSSFKFKKLTTKKGEQAYLMVEKSQSEKGMSSSEQQRHDQQQPQMDETKSGIIIHVMQDKQVQIINTKTTQKQWYVFNMKQSVQQVKGFLISNKHKVDDIRPSQDFLDQAVQLNAYATVGGSLGQCLADINNYDTANQFFVDLSKKTAISGAAFVIISEIPILSYFVIAGGFSYSFYLAFHNKATNNPQKFKVLGKATATALGTAGSSAAGALIGQALIPVPFLGAFVGGVVGGFIGAKTSKQISHVIDRAEFKTSIKYLKKHTIANSYWQYCPKLLAKLGINEKYFEQTNPLKGQSKNEWATAVGFCVVTLYQSHKYAEFTAKKLKKAQQKHQKVKPGAQQIYQSQFSIVQITDYLSTQKINLMENISHLQKLVDHLLY